MENREQREQEHPKKKEKIADRKVNVAVLIAVCAAIIFFLGVFVGVRL